MNLDQKLSEEIMKIKPLDEEAMAQCKNRWDSIAKPLHSLGKLEDHTIRIAGMTGDVNVRIDKRALIDMCADNGVVVEGVTQTGQEVTAIVAENFLDCNTSAALMCKIAGVDLYPYDVGMVRDTRVPRIKTMYGTRNLAKEPAMDREDALLAILAGIGIVKEKSKEGYEIFATGEMGIGNTTTSSAVAAVLTGASLEVMVGRGAGLDSDGLKRKKKAIESGISVNQPKKNDPIDVLSKVGGLDICGLVGVFLGCAIERKPALIDGFISGAAALAAYRICPLAKEYMIATHVSKEFGMRKILEELSMEAALNCDMCLGEGTGAISYLPVLDMGLAVYHGLSTFEDNGIEAYEDLSDK